MAITDAPGLMRRSEGRGAVSVRQKFVRQSLALLLGIVIGTGTAVFAGEFVRNPADAHLSAWGHTWPYSFDTSSCGWNTEVDPIQIVYYWDATTSKVHGHSSHHGSWSTNDGTTATQYFDNHGCSSMNGQNATGPIWSSRYHQRFDTANDPGWGNISLATPHYEDFILCGAQPKHAVRENESSGMPEGGFVNAKHKIDQLWHNWNNGGTHDWAGYQDWDNVRRFEQCDGKKAWGNGKVDFIAIE